MNFILFLDTVVGPPELLDIMAPLTILILSLLWYAIAIYLYELSQNDMAKLLTEEEQKQKSSKLSLSHSYPYGLSVLIIISYFSFILYYYIHALNIDLQNDFSFFSFLDLIKQLYIPVLVASLPISLIASINLLKAFVSSDPNSLSQTNSKKRINISLVNFTFGFINLVASIATIMQYIIKKI
jgi:hypothetical protein